MAIFNMTWQRQGNTMEQRQRIRWVVFCISIIVLFTSLFYSFFYPLSNATADSTWVLDSGADFEQGKVTNLDILSNGELTLGLDKKMVEDDYINSSMIYYHNSVILEPAFDQVKLGRINKVFGGNKSDGGTQISKTSDGGYIILGSTESFGSGGRDIILIKTDQFCNELWIKVFGGAKDDSGQAVLELPGEGYILSGSTASYGAGGPDLWVLKTDQGGNELWNKTYGDTSNDAGRDIAQTDDGNFAIAGYTIKPGTSNRDYWLVKIDKSGNKIWDKRFDLSNIDYCNCIAKTSDKGFILAGDSGPYGGDRHGWIVKTDRNGKELWNKTYGGIEEEIFYSVQQTKDGGYILAGDTHSNGADWGDAWLVKIDAAGKEVWNKHYGLSKHDGAYHVMQTDNGDFIVLGYTDSYEPVHQLWVFRTDSSGNLKWQKRYGGTSSTYSYGYHSINPSDEKYILLGSRTDYTSTSNIWVLEIDGNGEHVPTYGELISTNLLKGQDYLAVDNCCCNTSLSEGTSLKIQFSKDRQFWMNSKGAYNEWDELQNGFNSFPIQIEWQYSNFYYKLIFETNNSNIPIINDIQINYNTYLTDGIFQTGSFDTGSEPYWKTICWTCEEPEDTDIKLQIRTANTSSELKTQSFVGPDGGSNTYYEISGENIWAGHDYKRWIQLNVYLFTPNCSKSPILTEINIDYNNYPKFINREVIPKSGDITTKFNFTIKYQDQDNDPAFFVLACIDDVNYSMSAILPDDEDYSDGKSYWYCTQLSAGNHTYKFIISDGEAERESKTEILCVDYGPLDTIELEPTMVTISTDEFQTFNAKCFDKDKNRLSITPGWEVTGGGTIDQLGNFSADKPGVWKVYANHSGISGSTTITVVTGSLDKITIKPRDVKLNVSEQYRFTAQCYDSDGNELELGPIWSVTGGGKISTQGMFSATIPGNWIIYANHSGISSNATIKVLSKNNDKPPKPNNNGDKPGNGDEDDEKGGANEGDLFLFLILVIVIISILLLGFFFIYTRKPKKSTQQQLLTPNLQQQQLPGVFVPGGQGYAPVPGQAQIQLYKCPMCNSLIANPNFCPVCNWMRKQ
jgi:hypothetical protein